ncbi:hypothetical protein ACD661_04120 [Legionella lytica]|uniref:Uncharacterized protein n=1 Tax=Legionella lytica TaxID=96232 RepID=A0ABW8D8B8_9GAMM
MPTECNLFMIMDNSKYNRGVDLSKFYILIHYKKLGVLIKKQWKTLTVSLELSFDVPHQRYPTFFMVLAYAVQIIAMISLYVATQQYGLYLLYLLLSFYFLAITSQATPK